MKYPKEIKSMINRVRKLDGKPNGVIPRLKDDWYLIKVKIYINVKGK